MSRAALAEELTKRINPFIDIPWMGEAMEYRILYPVVLKAVPFIPEEIWPYLTDAADGITDEERAEWEPQILGATVEAFLAVVPEWLQPWFMDRILDMVRPVIAAVFDYAQGLLPGAAEAGSIGRVEDVIGGLPAE